MLMDYKSQRHGVLAFLWRRSKILGAFFRFHEKILITSSFESESPTSRKFWENVSYVKHLYSFGVWWWKFNYNFRQYLVFHLAGNVKYRVIWSWLTNNLRSQFNMWEFFLFEYHSSFCFFTYWDMIWMWSLYFIKMADWSPVYEWLSSMSFFTFKACQISAYVMG